MAPIMLSVKELSDDRFQFNKNVALLEARKGQMEKQLAQTNDLLAQQRGVLNYLDVTINKLNGKGIKDTPTEAEQPVEE